MKTSKLEKYRNRVDMLDSSILKQIAKRMQVVKKIGKFKKENNIEVVQKDRWDKVLKRVEKQAVELGLSSNEIKSIWNEIHKMAIAEENKVK